MPDDVARWAASRAPALLARAEEEAVAILRDALVRAALPERSHEARPAAAQEPPASELVWTYCVTTVDVPAPAELAGVAGRRVERLERAGLAALVGRVPAAEFAEEPLRRNLNELAWVERVARAHEAVLRCAFAAGTIVPLRLCTIYESDASVEAMLEREQGAFSDALARLAGREEWAVKLLVDADKLADAAAAQLDEGADETGESTGGGAYMLRRRRDRRVRALADSLAAEVGEQVHSRLAERAIDAVTLPAQNRDLSRHEGEMLLNSAYLVETDRVDDLRVLAAELEQRHEALGARVVLSGPWPPHNFVARV
jgi:hypothetical protein